MVFSGGFVGGYELHAHGLGLLGEVVQDPLAVALLEVILPLGEHGVEQAGQLVGAQWWAPVQASMPIRQAGSEAMSSSSFARGALGRTRAGLPVASTP